MKKIVFIFVIPFLLTLRMSGAENLKPYILGLTLEKPLEEVITPLRTQMEAQGFKILGEYTPANDANRRALVVTHPELMKAIKIPGDLTGLAAALRVGLTKEGEQVIVSYTNPAYWGNAYYRDDFPQVEEHYGKVSTAFEKSLEALGSYDGTGFGSEKGKSIKDLRKYRYMIGMPRFDDPVKLAEFNNFEEAVSKIDTNIQNGVKDVGLVYSLNFPGQNLKLYGFALSGKDGESKFLPKIDIAQPRHTAFLPYEMLVVDNQVFMLHGRYRIALSFPDLTMSTFTKIMSTPGDIKELLQSVTK